MPAMNGENLKGVELDQLIAELVRAQEMRFPLVRINSHFMIFHDNKCMYRLNKANPAAPLLSLNVLSVVKFRDSSHLLLPKQWP